MKPLEDRVIIKPTKVVEERTATGLILASPQNDKENQGTIIEVGPGRVLPSGVRIEMDLAVGDIVVFNPMAVQSFERDGEEFHVSFTKDILAIIGHVDD
ncbi:GroS Co-chaperonin GroES (HSP10) [uncultured Caudovirales phage]|uniref:GroS Co-chaperonin GroES (HSP10) n=1 Tax=uncultured Caudovirales phage TaxID=2100421 RepID=A0A6J5TDE0_9CAUD|nr:GroS Co-chaperonin GroES (HSP10) [uncultured Caudovirales phage]CAB5219594.1 GroS Co-chaperonin GroES (HSP10) [uncultured Caudovirales phage]